MKSREPKERTHSYIQITRPINFTELNNFLETSGITVDGDKSNITNQYRNDGAIVAVKFEDQPGPTIVINQGFLCVDVPIETLWAALAESAEFKDLADHIQSSMPNGENIVIGSLSKKEERQ